MRPALLLVLAACGRLNFDPADAFVVTTTLDRLAGPATMTSIDEVDAPDLSLREALTLSANVRGAQLVLFDAQLFPEDAPGVIAISSTLEVAGDTTTVDGRGRGVVIEAPDTFDAPLLRISDAGNSVIGMTVRGGAGARVLVDGATNARVERTSFPQPGHTAVQVSGATGGGLVTLDIVRADGAAILVDRSTSFRIENATITEPVGIAILATLSSDLEIGDSQVVLDKAASNPGIRFETVDASTIHDCVIDPGPVQLISFDSSSRNEVVGNILDGGNVGIAMFGPSLDNLFYRDVIIASSDEPVFVDTVATGNRLINNTLFMTGGISDGAPDTQIANILMSDQASDFRDAASYNFKLSSGNPAIDAGVDLGLDLVPGLPERFLGAAPDLGAVETE